jgi:glutamate dehydrogenase/leucine dehydrogenase
VALRGARVSIQGYGAVGRWAARFLAERGAVVVAASDSRGGAVRGRGLDLDALDALKAEGRSVAEIEGATRTGPEEVITAECDILVPAARPDVIREDNADAIRARVVLEGANIPATGDAERRLHVRGVLVVPDFVANAGGVICAAVEYRGGGEREAFSVIAEKVRRNTAEVLRRAAAEGIAPRAAARAVAEDRVRRAMAFRR